MSAIAFNCPFCDQHLEAPADLTGEMLDCPACNKPIQVPAKPKAATAPLPSIIDTQYPIIVRASPRALYSKYIRSALVILIALVVLVSLSRFAKARMDEVANIFILMVWIPCTIAAVVHLFGLWFNYLRLMHTEYRIYERKIEKTSYLFRFLGTYNNVVNLSQLRQIQAFSNSLLDMWFFGCGYVKLTVSGDVADLYVENVYSPGSVKQQIEEVAFGETSGDASTVPEVGGDA